MRRSRNHRYLGLADPLHRPFLWSQVRPSTLDRESGLIIPSGWKGTSMSTDLHSSPRNSLQAAVTISKKIYADVFAAMEGGPNTDAAKAEELHFVLRMLQVMELAWSEVGLDEFDDHALNMGWVEVLRRWAKSPVVQKYWPHIRKEFSHGFQRYFDHIGVVS